MAGRKTKIRIELSPEERRELEQLARSQSAEYRKVVRARMILGVADGHTITDVAMMVGRRRTVVTKWAKRFCKKRLRGLTDDPRSGRPPIFSPSRGDASDQAGV